MHFVYTGIAAERCFIVGGSAFYPKWWECGATR